MGHYGGGYRDRWSLMVRYYRSMLGDLGIDGRTARGRDVLKLKRKLVQHVGGYPTPFQMLWIERALIARERLHALEGRMQAKARWTEGEMKTYAVFDTSFRKALSKLAYSKSEHGRNPKVLSLFELVGQHKAGN